MRKKITVLILNHAGSGTRQIVVSKTLVLLGILVMLGGLGYLGAEVFHYYRQYQFLSNEVANKEHLEDVASDQLDEIIAQRRQIQVLASEINTLKSKLIALNTFEKRIRIIANLENSNEEGGVFGIGGSLPEDIEPKIKLTEKHNTLIRKMHDQVEDLSRALVHQKKTFQDLVKNLENQRTLLASTPAIRPTQGLVTSDFGRRKSPYTGLTEFHKGTDIANRKGTPVIATADGTITFAAQKGFWGKMITIDHGHGMITRYAHLSKFLKKRGDKVKRGDTIGLIGNSGRSTGPHLHYEVRLNGVPINPANYILN